MMLKCFIGLLFLWISMKEIELFDIESISICYGNTHSSFDSIECGTGEVILVRNTRAMAKLASTGCPVEMTWANENTMSDNCCIYEAVDCGAVYTGSVYQTYYERCHGNQLCASLQASWVDIVDLDCNQTLYLPRTNYMIFTYSCIPTTFIKSPCEGIQTTNTSVFLWNSGYPNEMSPGSDSCTCAAEVSCNSTIVVTAIDLRFQNVSDACLQSIVVTEGGDQTVIGCQGNNDFLEATIYTSTSQFITFEITNSLQESGGYFWIQVSGQDEKAEITLSCGPSSISEAESTDKPVCGQGDTTTSSTTTSTTTTTITTTTGGTSTTTSSTSSTTTIDTSTTTSTPSGSSTVASNTSTVSTTTTTDSNETSTSLLNGTTATTTSPDNGTDTTTDSLTTDSTTANDTNAGASQTTGGSSGSPLGIIVAVVVVLIILIIIAIILVCKREQLKKKFCPNKVEDGDGSTEEAEYATMTNPFLTDTAAFPLITGRAATSTHFPSLPTKKPNQLAPLSTPPVLPDKKPNQLAPITAPPSNPDVDIYHLSSSLKYRLPKLEGIQRPMARENSSISAQLVEEHKRKPFPAINRIKPEAEVDNDVIGDSLSKSVGGERLSETVKERHVRKKKKRMVDRLNRIRLPGHDGRDSGLGFGSSSQRF